MNKCEVASKIDEIKKLADDDNYREAARLLERIEIKKIKDIKDLYRIITIYIENERYSEARRVLKRIARKGKSKRVVHQLIDINIKSERIDAAKKYMRQFKKLAPNDPYNYVFEYQLANLLEESYDMQVEILEKLKQQSYLEKWAYELAKSYYMAGRIDDSMAECKKLIECFREGVYVDLAKNLLEYLEIVKLQEKNRERNQVVQDEIESTIVQEEAKSVQKEEVKPLEKEEFVPYNERERTSYQCAFDFIEDMETRQRDEEIDQIIEAAERRQKLEKQREDLESIEEEQEQEENGQGQEENEDIAPKLSLKDELAMIEEQEERESPKQLNDFFKRQGYDTDLGNEILGQFARVQSIAEQIHRSLEMLTQAYTKKRVIGVCGNSSEEETLLSRRLAKLYHALQITDSNRLVILPFRQFIELDFTQCLSQIKGGCVIVEDVEQEMDAISKQIDILSENGCFVILEFNYRYYINPLKEAFGLEVITMESYTLEELMGFVEEFVEEKAYSMEEDAKTYCKLYITGLLNQAEPRVLCKVLDKIRNAYHCANRRNRLELRNIAESGRYEDAVFMSIRYTDLTNEN